MDGGRTGRRIGGSVDAPTPLTMPTVTLPPVLRPAVQADAEFLYGLWDAEARRQSFTGGPPTMTSHLAWLKAVLADPQAHLFVAMEGGRPVGSARLDVEGREATVSVMVADRERRRGLGTAILGGLDAEARPLGIGSLRAEIFETNTGSRTAFANAGYRIADIADGVVTMGKEITK